MRIARHFITERFTHAGARPAFPYPRIQAGENGMAGPSHEDDTQEGRENIQGLGEIVESPVLEKADRYKLENVCAEDNGAAQPGEGARDFFPGKGGKKPCNPQAEEDGQHLLAGNAETIRARIERIGNGRMPGCLDDIPLHAYGYSNGGSPQGQGGNAAQGCINTPAQQTVCRSGGKAELGGKLVFRTDGNQGKTACQGKGGYQANGAPWTGGGE